MMQSDLELAILELIRTIYCKDYTGRIKVTETFDGDQHLGYILNLGLNKDERPLSIACECSKEDFIPFIKEELLKRHLELTEYFTAIQLYRANE